MGLTSWRAALTSRCWGGVDVMAGGAHAIGVVTCVFFLAGGGADIIIGFGALEVMQWLGLARLPLGLSEDPDLGAEGER